MTKKSTFIPAISFTGYPEEDTKPVKFTAGIESVPVPAEFIALVRDKGYIDESAGKPTEEKAKRNDREQIAGGARQSEG
ncbi:hypothetical protein OIU34_02360 [Pararhizobium sp. BT-229]|uniref:hypothetical protein n=1 Tax=Pararhizobium sp. BT-229 TaxID=2986923 RepID=UPI0021F72D46|nr:hypothetical protein [Pararhizobium sp. BT-229]MCV9960730.1 hypothetical protein [Pararhizobium sp. BT-229]